MTDINKGLIALGIALIAIFGVATFAYANPSFFPPLTTTGTGIDATTTGTYMAFGIGTTTLTLDTYQTGNNTKADKAYVGFIVNSTTTISSPTLKARIEDSQNGVDWFPRSTAVNTNATTTSMSTLFTEMLFAIATTTQDVGGTSKVNTGGATTTLSFTLDTPLRYVRVKFYDPASSGNYTLWAFIQPQKERN